MSDTELTDIAGAIINGFERQTIYLFRKERRENIEKRLEIYDRIRKLIYIVETSQRNTKKVRSMYKMRDLCRQHYFLLNDCLPTIDLDNPDRYLDDIA
jgi:hypothetical protein